jgi:hypothetical protein
MPDIRERYLSFIAHTGSCARPNPSCLLGHNLVRQVFVDCCKSPLGRWPFPTLSLQSLRRCLDPYPVVFSKCSCSLLPWRQRPHLNRHKFGTPNYPRNATSTGNCISRLQSFRYVQAPTLARPPGCTHRCGSKPQGSRAVYTTHSSVGYLPRDVVSLRIRHEQLIRLDFHQLDCSLVGRSYGHTI